MRIVHLSYLLGIASGGSGVVPFAWTRNATLRFGLNRLRQTMPAFFDALYGEDPAEPGRFYARIMLRARERQPAEQKLAVIRKVGRISREAFPQTDTTCAYSMIGPEGRAPELC